jgi:hypothetical protein
MNLNDRELNTVLAALREWQATTTDFERREHMIAADNGVKPLTDDEIDALCDRLNTEVA